MSQENVELIRSVFEACNRADLEGALALADPPPEFEFVPHGVLIPDLSRVQRGPDGLMRLWEGFFFDFDDLHADYELTDAGDRVYSSFTLRGRGKQSGVETSFDGWLVWTVRNGRLVRWLGFTYRAAALEAAGLSE